MPQLPILAIDAHNAAITAHAGVVGRARKRRPAQLRHATRRQWRRHVAAPAKPQATLETLSLALAMGAGVSRELHTRAHAGVRPEAIYALWWRSQRSEL